MDIDDLGARQRAQAKAAATRKAKKRGDRAAFWDGGVFTAGAGSQPAESSSNGALRLGQSVPLLQAGGSNRVDTFSSGIVDEPYIPPPRKGDVTVLARVIRDGITQLWIGGDRIRPLKILETNKNLWGSPQLDKTGPGKDDWIVGYKLVNSDFTGWSIGVIYGRQDEENDQVNWEISNDAAENFQYVGMGFWVTTPFAYKFWEYESISVVNDINPLPPLIEEECRAGSGGNTTVTVPYCAVIEKPTPSSTVSVSTTTQQGFKASAGLPTGFDALGYQFTGVNDYQFVNTQSDSWEGDAQGPGFLGPGGQSCTLGSPIIEGTALYPQRRGTTVETTVINFNAQSFSFSAHQGAIAVSQGSHARTQNALVTSTSEAPATVRQIDYLAQCESYVQPTQDLWSIGIVNFETWPLIPFSQARTNMGITTIYSNPVPLAPGVSKDYRYTVFEPNDSTAPQGSPDTAEYYTAGVNFVGGHFYIQRIQSGVARFFDNTPQLVAFPFFLPGSSLQTKFFVNFKGTDFELNQEIFSPFTTWKEIENEPYPVGFQPRYNEDYTDDQNDIFQNTVFFDIFERKAMLQSGKLVYEDEKLPQAKKALTMKAIGTKPEALVLDVKYWNR